MNREPVAILYEPRINYLNLYRLNLQVYVSAKFIVCRKFDDLVYEIKNNEVDLILMNLAKEEKTDEKLKKINSMIQSKTEKPICFVQAATIVNYSELQVSDADILVKDIVSSVAQKMAITAKHMSELQVGEYYPISLRFVMPGWQVAQAIYRKKKDNSYSVILDKGLLFTQVFINELGSDTDIYCKSIHRLEIINSFTATIKSILDQSNLPIEERFEQTEIAFELITEAVGVIDLPNEIINLSRATIRSMEKIVVQIPSLASLYRSFVKQNSSMRFKHSLLMIYLGQFIIQKQSWNTPHITQQWTYLCFFHDIALDRDEYLDFEYDEDVKNSDFSSVEKNLILNHAQITAKLLADVKDIPVGLDVLIKQHHGSKMGNTLSGVSMSISPICIIFIMLENYVHFFLSKNEAPKTTKEITNFIEDLFIKFPFPNYKRFIPFLRSIPIKY
jgi:hypothetical protein